MKTSKKAEIKLRVTEHQKDKLKRLAKDHNESISSYILNKSLGRGQGLLEILPQQIEDSNFLNEIYHMVEMYGSESLKKEIKKLYESYAAQKRKDDGL